MAGVADVLKDPRFRVGREGSENKRGIITGGKSKVSRVWSISS